MSERVSLSISADVECPECGTEIDIVRQSSQNADPEFWDWLKKWIGPQSEESVIEVECDCGHTFEISTKDVEW